MPKIDLDSLPLRTGSAYPERYAKGFEKRSSLRVGDAGGLTQFGANIVILQPGGRSSLRHWHTHQDEFVIVISGELTLIDDTGETALAEGECCAFPADDENGHTIANNSGQEGKFLVVGTRSEYELAYYSDIDLKVEQTDGTSKFTRKDGSPI
ncbi:MAG: cupin domain-containing protein [Marinosulfonomonas sp.]